LLQASAPDRDRLVVAVACLFTWYWLADLWTHEGLAFVLGPALSMQAIHGGTAKNDQSDAPKLAVVLRGGRLPQAAVDPAARRATRAFRRRRMPLRRNRAALRSQVQHTHSPYHRPESGQKRANTANRVGARPIAPLRQCSNVSQGIWP
jgi:transposase